MVRVTLVTLVMLMLVVAILTRRSPTLTSPQSLEKTASSRKQSNSAVLNRTSACSVARPDTLPKSVPKHLPPPPKPALPPPWTRTLMPSLAWSQKSMSSPQHSTPIEDCIELTGAPMEPWLNASALYNPNSLMITLNSDLLLTTDICTLIDSGSPTRSIQSPSDFSMAPQTLSSALLSTFCSVFPQVTSKLSCST